MRSVPPAALPASPVFGIDVDGVLADLVHPLLDAVFAQTGTRFFPEDITRFDLAGILGPTCWAAAHQILSSPGFAQGLPLLPGAREGVAALRSRARVVFVTAPFAPSPTWAYDRAAWLATHFQAQPADIVSLPDKTLFRGDLLVDDSPAQLDAWTRAGRIAIRMSLPWNAGAPGIPAQDWGDVLRIVEDLLGSPHAARAAAG